MRRRSRSGHRERILLGLDMQLVFRLFHQSSRFLWNCTVLCFLYKNTHTVRETQLISCELQARSVSPRSYACFMETRPHIFRGTQAWLGAMGVMRTDYVDIHNNENVFKSWQSFRYFIRANAVTRSSPSCFFVRLISIFTYLLTHGSATLYMYKQQSSLPTCTVSIFHAAKYAYKFVCKSIFQIVLQQRTQSKS